jgi:hypothetical protein
MFSLKTEAMKRLEWNQADTGDRFNRLIGIDSNSSYVLNCLSQIEAIALFMSYFSIPFYFCSLNITLKLENYERVHCLLN